MSGIQPMSYRRLLREEQQRDEELSRQLSRDMIASESSDDSSSAKNQIPDEDMSFLSRMGFDVEGLNRDSYIYRGVCNRAAEKVEQSKGKAEFREGMQFIVKLKIINSEEQYSEAKQLAELQHSFIVKVLFVFNIQYNRMYVFSEYPDRGFFTYLLKTMRENSQLFVNNQCIQFIIQLTTGLKYLHDMNVLHGNINSKNVLK
jgi:serine/threonine protein kinase